MLTKRHDPISQNLYIWSMAGQTDGYREREVERREVRQEKIPFLPQPNNNNQ